MPHTFVLFLLIAGGFWSRDLPEEPVEPTRVLVPPLSPPPPALHGDLFPADRPMPLGPTPEGLANPTAQACRACHWTVTEEWAKSAHGRAPSKAFTVAVVRSGEVRCLSCHRPFMEQIAEISSPNPNAPSSLSPGFEPTLMNEQVTCAACHIRDGRILSAKSDASGPHPMTWAPSLGASETCAACHQLTWPGAQTPFYDTYGEWSRTAYAAAGIGCVDCHMTSGVRRDMGRSHRVDVDPSRGVSLLLNVDSLSGAIESDIHVSLRLQNTGAGHHFPTGSPYSGVRVEAGYHLDGTSGLVPAIVFSEHLGRTVSEEAPWRILSDTRIEAGGERTWTFPLRLPSNSPAGDWVLDVWLIKTQLGEPVGEPFALQTVKFGLDAPAHSQGPYRVR